MNDIIAAELKRIIYEAVRDALKGHQPPAQSGSHPTPLPVGVDDLPLIMSPKTLGDRLDVSVTTLARWRREGIGPAYFEPKGLNMIRYRREDVLAWLDQGMVAKHVLP